MPRRGASQTGSVALRREAGLAAAAACLLALPGPALAAPRGFTPSTTNPTVDYNPTYLGNGLLGVRVPADGEDFLTTPIASEAPVAGLYEQYLNSDGIAVPPGVTALDVAAPQWTGLTLSDGTDAWSASSGKLLR